MHDTAWMTLDPASHRPLTRREVLKLLGASLAAPLFSGCATSPVTGQTIFVGMSEAQEIALDRQLAPQQFSQDLGPIQQASVNAYVGEVGLWAPQIPLDQGMAQTARAYAIAG